MTVRHHRYRVVIAARFLTAGGGAVLLAAATAGTDPTTGSSSRPAAMGSVATTAPAVDPAIAALIHRLGADAETDRTDAQRQLVDLGDVAVDPLRRAADGDADPEVRSRAAAALAQIRDRAANGPTLVTLHLDHAAPTEALTALGTQAHAEFTDVTGGPFGAIPGLAGKGRVTISADRRPFWDVMADVCGQLGVCPSLNDSGNHAAVQLAFPPRSWIRSAPHQVVGPFWVGVASLYRSSTVDLSGPPVDDNQFFARLIVFPEPKLVVTQVSPLAVREATDDAGNSLVLPPAARTLGRMLGRLRGRSVDARLRYPDHPGHRITTLAGDLTVTLAQGSQRFEVDDVTGHPTVTRPLPGVDVRVAVSPLGPNEYQVTVECTRAGMADAQWYATTARLNELSVEDGAGRTLSSLYWTFDSGNDQATFKATGRFSRSSPMLNRIAAVGGLGANAPALMVPPPAGEPRRVVWDVASRFKVVTVPVAFHDLPMP